MKNIKILRDELNDVFESLLNKQISTKEAKGLANLAGKIIGSTKVEIDYAKLHKKSKTIDFLEY